MGFFLDKKGHVDKKYVRGYGRSIIVKVWFKITSKILNVPVYLL